MKCLDQSLYHHPYCFIMSNKITGQNYNGNSPENLTLITDGNPIYNAAQVFFDINDIKFDLHQVIGVKNKDEISKKYRPFKQIEERLNRTYKQNYYGTNGYDKLEGANSYMILFVCFFNFLRQHSSLKYKTPVSGLFDNNMLCLISGSCSLRYHISTIQQTINHFSKQCYRRRYPHCSFFQAVFYYLYNHSIQKNSKYSILILHE